MHDDVAFAVDQPQRNQPHFAIAATGIDPLHDVAFKNQDLNDEVDTMLGDIGQPLALIPFEDAIGQSTELQRYIL